MQLEPIIASGFITNGKLCGNKQPLPIFVSIGKKTLRELHNLLYFLFNIIDRHLYNIDSLSFKYLQQRNRGKTHDALLLINNLKKRHLLPPP